MPVVLSNDDLKREESQFDSIYFHQQTFTTALLSAGSAINTCMAVARGQVKNAIAVIRPPGHHAVDTQSMGFCHFDNVAISAKAVKRAFPEKYRKILILDWWENSSFATYSG